MDPKAETESLSTRLNAGDWLVALMLALTMPNRWQNLHRVFAYMFGLSDLPNTAVVPKAEELTKRPAASDPSSECAIYYAHRWGVWVAYILTQAPAVDDPQVQPHEGMMIFSDEAHVTTKTGRHTDLERLGKETGLKVIMVPPDTFFVPFTSLSSVDDARRFGHLVMPYDQAVLWALLPNIPREELPASGQVR